MDKDIVVGIDMGATHIRICIMNLYQQVFLTQKGRTSDVINRGLLDGIRDFIQQYCVSYTIRKIVIGLPAAISRDRKHILSVPNLVLDQTQIEQLVVYLQDMFNCPVQLERDVNLQLLYDVHHFELQNKNVVGVYLGTGLGFAIYQQGNLYLGQHGVAGELGHIPYGDTKKQCQCGNYGCLETSCSGKALKEWYEQEERDYLFEDTFKEVINSEFIQQYLHHLARALATVINLFDPDCIVLGGGVIDMYGFPYQQLKQQCLAMVRKPLPHDQICFYQAQSSDFNGAIGAALQATV